MSIKEIKKKGMEKRKQKEKREETKLGVGAGCALAGGTVGGRPVVPSVAGRYHRQAAASGTARGAALATGKARRASGMPRPYAGTTTGTGASGTGHPKPGAGGTALSAPCGRHAPARLPLRHVIERGR